MQVSDLSPILSPSIEYKSYLDPKNRHITKDLLGILSNFLAQEAVDKHLKFEELRGRKLSPEEAAKLDIYDLWEDTLRANDSILPHLLTDKSSMAPALQEAVIYKNLSSGKCELRDINVNDDPSPTHFNATFFDGHFEKLASPIKVEGKDCDGLVCYRRIADGHYIFINFFSNRSLMKYKKISGNFQGLSFFAQADTRGHLFVATPTCLNVIDLRSENPKVLYALDLKVDQMGLDAKGFLRVHPTGAEKDVVKILDFTNPKAPEHPQVNVTPPPTPPAAPPLSVDSPSRKLSDRFFSFIRAGRPLFNLAVKVACVALLALALAIVLAVYYVVGLLAFKVIQLESVTGAAAAAGLWISARL